MSRALFDQGGCPWGGRSLLPAFKRHRVWAERVKIATGLPEERSFRALERRVRQAQLRNGEACVRACVC